MKVSSLSVPLLLVLAALALSDSAFAQPAPQDPESCLTYFGQQGKNGSRNLQGNGKNNGKDKETGNDKDKDKDKDTGKNDGNENEENDNNNNKNGPHCWVCHGTGSVNNNPYTSFCVDANSLDKNNGHAQHNNYDGKGKLDDFIWCPDDYGLESDYQNFKIGLDATFQAVDGKTYDVKTCAPVTNAGSMGDPHIKTWTGDWYDYHGECDLVLLSAPSFDNGVGLDIHIRTTIRYEYSHIESVAIKIGQQDVLQFNSWGSYILNGIVDASLPALMAEQYVVKHAPTEENKDTYRIVLSDKGEVIELKALKYMVSVKLINPQAENFQDSAGLMGDFHTGLKIARDGQTVLESVNEFGQEWQVLEHEPRLFETVRFPQHPQQCRLPDTTSSSSSSKRRRLGESIARQAAEEACANWGDAKEQCVYDVMATGDLELAQAGAF